ncbi:MAG: hypothetical protein QXF48_00350 [Candidatus Anstonellaceae archaeon]
MTDVVVFEISSEIARKIGGIYTVIKTKSSYIQKYYPNSYYYIGFYDERCTQELRLLPPPPFIKKVFDELSSIGIFCYYGEWIYANNAPVLLVDAKQFSSKLVEYVDDNNNKRHDIQLNYIKYQLWRHFTIDSLMEKSWDFNENVGWGWAVGILLEKLLETEEFKTKKIVAQFHEWISGAALLYCKLRNLPIACVFTTHATVLGRTLSATGIDVLSLAYNSVTPIELSKAYELKVEGKHQLEVQAAKKADVFSCVSEVVGQESRYILGVSPDIITINGIDLENSIHEAQLKNLSSYVRSELLQLAEAVFLPFFNARYDNALLVFISGRYEFKNKGFDIFLKGLSYANKQILSRGITKDKQILAFIFTPSSISGPKISVIKNYLLIDKISEILDALPALSPKKHYANILERIENTKNENLYYDLKAMLKNFVKESKDPPISLFDLNYPNDQIILTCLKEGLNNSQSNPVKVLFYPTYLNPNDGLINMNYSDVIAGMDVGVFPSRYEPFGYTPLEAALKYNIAVSTNWAGFGRYLISSPLYNEKAIKILNLNQSEEKIAQDLGNFFVELYYLEPQELFKRKEEAFKMTRLFDWANLAKNYVRAYELAISKFFTTERKFYAPPIPLKVLNPLNIAKDKLAYVVYENKNRGINKKTQNTSKKSKSKKLKKKN